MVEFTYTAGERERRLECDAATITRLRAWWVPGGVLIVVSVVLTSMAAEGGAGGAAAGWALAAIIASGTLLIYPYFAFEQQLKRMVRWPGWERRITVSEAGMHVDAAGLRLDLDWSRIRKSTETRTHWRFYWDSGAGLAVPKSAIPEADWAELARLAELAGTIPSPLDG